MPNQLLIRDVPAEIYSWIRSERGRTGKSQNEVVLDLLKDAYAFGGQRPLFSSNATTRIQIVPRALPFNFVDLFAGIGGMRLGLTKIGGRCIWSSEWDRWAQKTYFAWFGETPHGDIRQIDPASIPTHDVLAAGFPCQPFSIAGVSKKNSLGRKHGFADETQGTLFFNLAKIVEAKRPPILLLENVKNLKSHDSGRTWSVIRTTLESLRYRVFADVVDAAGWVPQHRERFFIVAFNLDRFEEPIGFDFPKPPSKRRRLREILDAAPEPRYTLSDHLWTYLQAYAAKHRAMGNGFGFGLADLNGIARTLSARYFKDGSEILIPQRGRNPRRLTPRECARLMGFDDELPIVVSDTQAYRQFGNAVPPPLVQAVGSSLVSVMTTLLQKDALLATRIA